MGRLRPEGSPRVWAAAEAPRGPRGWKGEVGAVRAQESPLPRPGGRGGRSVGRRPPGQAAFLGGPGRRRRLLARGGHGGPEPPAPRRAAAGRGRACLRAAGIRGHGVQGWSGSTRPGAGRDRTRVGGPLTWGSCRGRRDESASGSVGPAELTGPEGSRARRRGPRSPPPGGSAPPRLLGAARLEGFEPRSREPRGDRVRAARVAQSRALPVPRPASRTPKNLVPRGNIGLTWEGGEVPDVVPIS